MLSIFQVAGSVAQRPGRKGAGTVSASLADGRNAHGPHTGHLVLLSALPWAQASVCPGVKAHVISSSKKRRTSVANWLVMLFKQSDKTPYVLVWEPGCRGMQTKQRASQKPARMHWDACTRRERWRHHHVAWQREALWSQRPVSSCVKGSRKTGEMKARAKCVSWAGYTPLGAAFLVHIHKGTITPIAAIPPGFSFSFFFKFIYLFLATLGLHCCAQAFSQAAASGGYTSLRCEGFSLQWLLIVEQGL